MFGKKEFIGLTIQDDAIRVARIRVDGSSLNLVKLDQYSLVEKISSESSSDQQGHIDAAFEDKDLDEDADSIFGLEEEGQEEEEEIDFEGLEEEAEDFAMDMVDESEEAESNELLVYDLLTDLQGDKLHMGLNIPAGDTIFQIIRDTDFSEVKRKDLIEDLEDKLESIYGMPKTEDNYSYQVREDGSLLLASIDDESSTLKLINNVRELYSGKMAIQNIIPDEIALVGLVRANYELDADELTGIVQFGKEQCRVVFMKGEDIWLVSPIINEGTNKKTFLNTVFSKILFQLDTGEVPSLDRILLTNNTLGQQAVEFFEDNFPDIYVEDFTFKEEFFDLEHVDPSSVPSFTTAIGTAIAASGAKEEFFPEISFVPKYVQDRQKIFQLQWHGMLILFLIFLAPITVNYFYTQNAQEIDQYSTQLEQMESQINELDPIVANSKELQDNLATLREKLVMLDTLTKGSQEWSAKLQILNRGMRNVGSSWLASFTQNSSGEVSLQGYTLYRSRIPKIIDVFEDATLLDVQKELIREQNVYNFSISIKEFIANDSLYSPATPQEVQKLIGK
ncbi:PilN domain-containing protein [Fodinibius halophilus]|uniref:PilN domain-containing protein n=1 Tax=Fodinibius halophilus TaxID=1736908 RepID=A0A6M1TH58_9BACT|nr:hypothetical protein [Fodinibius halophilus]NGP87990.1 hypothetical protein [Fodinibius halophilus]